MSVLSFLSLKKTSAKIKYVKETVLIEEKAPTKIILKFVVSFSESEYDVLLEMGNPVIVVKMPATVGVIEDSAEITQYKLIDRDLTKESFKPKDYGYLSSDSDNILEEYMDAAKEFEEITRKWIGLHWKPRDDSEDYKFYAPLYPLLEQVSSQDIFLRLPEEKPPTIDGKCNLGLMLNFYTKDIPFRKGHILETRIDIQNTEGNDYESLPKDRIIGIENGELWVVYPENSLISIYYPNADRIFTETKEDEENIQKYSKKLYNVGKWPFHKPRIKSVLLRWDIDRHIKDWETNTLTFFSQALLVDTFLDSLQNSILSEVRSMIDREFELFMKKTLIEGPKHHDVSTDPTIMQLEKGNCYLLEGGKVAKGYEIFAKYLNDNNTRGLCMIRGFPNPSLENIEPWRVEIVNLDTTGFSGSISPSDSQAIIEKVEKFLEEGETLIVFLDIIDYLYYYHDFDFLMQLLNTIIDVVRKFNGVLLVVANPKVFEDRISVLEKQFKLIDLAG